MIMTPEHIKCYNAPNIKIKASTKWHFKEVYEWVRVGNMAIKDGRPREYGSYSEVDILGMHRFGFVGHATYVGGAYLNEPYVQFRFNSAGELQPWSFRYEAVLFMDVGDNDMMMPTAIHWRIAYAVLEKGEPDRNGRMDITMTFYDPEDRPIISITIHADIRCKEGKYVIDPEFHASKKKRVDGGCLFCDKAIYQKEGGIVYIACTKYGGRVAEVEYTGEAYPDYCKKRA